MAGNEGGQRERSDRAGVGITTHLTLQATRRSRSAGAPSKTACGSVSLDTQGTTMFEVIGQAVGRQGAEQGSRQFVSWKKTMREVKVC